MSRLYSVYHTNIKLCFALGIEKEILPNHFLETIPAATSQYWKKNKDKNFSGSEFENITDSGLKELSTLADHRIKTMRKVFVGFVKLYIVIIEIIGREKLRKILIEHRKTLIPKIDSIQTLLPNKAILLKLLGITKNQYSHWKLQEQYACAKSMIWLCYKRVPRQISMKEITMMKKLMSEKDKRHWSSAAVWGYAEKHGEISMARTTWYFYCKLLKLNDTRKKYKKVIKRISVRATKPNEIWHMDVSVYKTSENVRYYIYSVIDNFSRKILAYDYSTKLSRSIRLKSLKRAVEIEFGNNAQLKENTKVDLIVDGGKENNNISIEGFIKTCQVDITKKIALRDVFFSNSMIESSFRMMKFYYLKPNIREEDFPEKLKRSVEDINFLRPHHAHLIYTPNEIHCNPELKNVKPVLEKVNYARIAENWVFRRDCAIDLGQTVPLLRSYNYMKKLFYIHHIFPLRKESPSRFIL